MLTGKIAIITGQSRGLGKVLADKFRDAGAIVPDCNRWNVDVTQWHEVSAYVYRVLDAHGHVDILINNAAILGPVGPLETINVGEWSKTIQTNLTGPMYFCSSVLKDMKKRGSGKIINICGAAEPMPRRAAYAASKAGLIRLTDSLAQECEGIEINGVLPGPMPTDMFDEIIAAGPDALGSAVWETHFELKPMLKTAADLPTKLAADLCVYLASEASNGLTGKLISARHDPFPFDVKSLMKSNTYTMRRIGAIYAR